MRRYVSRAELKLDLLLNAAPYLINKKGTGSAKQQTPPSKLDAGPRPRFSNIGRAAMGIAHARTDRRMVLAETALAAYGPYVSTRKFIHC